MNQLPILLKREFWENKGIFLYVPLTLSALVILLILLTAFVVKVNVEVDEEGTNQGSRRDRDFEWRIEASDTRPVQDVYIAKLQELSHKEAWEQEEALAGLLRIVSGPIRVSLWFVIIFYLLGSLYEDRKDRSVLFWKSMPVSDAMTVVSKLLAAVILAPAIAFLFILATQLSVLVIASILAISAEVSVWSTLWGPAQLYTYWPLVLAALTLQAFWSLPIYGFVMLVSSYARSVPLIWVLAVPAVIALVEKMLLPVDLFTDFFFNHLRPLSVGVEPGDLRGWPDLLQISFSLDMGFGVIAGIGLLVATVWLRGRSDEI